MNTYTDGTIVECLVQFFNDQNVAADPTTVTFKYSPGGGATVTLTFSGATTPAVGVVAKLAVGEYETQLDTTGVTGTWTYEYLASGLPGLQGNAATTFVVVARAL